MTRKKILVADDNPVELKTLKMKLSSSGYDVLLAEDGATVVNTARLQKPDLIVLDMNFPPDVAHGGGVPWDGCLILSWLRRMEELKSVPVVLVTGEDTSKVRNRAQAVGAAKIFHKPYDIQELLNAIENALASKQTKEGTKKRILFIDDEGDWRVIAGSYLEDAGFEVVTARDIAEALSRMENIKLDAIILDINLGKENGLLLMELLKQKHPNVPILVYTGMEHDAPTIQAMLKQGARKYLRKGTMTELTNALTSMVN